MKSFYQSKYELALDELILKHGVKTVCKSLIEALQVVIEKKEQVMFTSRPVPYLKSVIKQNDSNIKITIGGLKTLVNKTVIHELSDDLINEQAIIIYKYLANAYVFEFEDLPDIEQGIISIKDERVFPIEDITKTNLDGKFRAFSNIFSNATAEPTKQTLKFGLSILGIIPDIFEREFLHSESESEKLVLTETKKRIPALLYVFLVATILLLVIYSAIVYQAEKREFHNLTPTELQVPSSQIFRNSFQLSETVATDHSLSVSIISFDYLSSNSAILKFRIINTSEQTFFPDRLKLSFDQTLERVSAKKTGINFPQNLKQIDLPKEGDFHEIILINKSKEGTIEPSSEVHGLLQINFENHQSFRLIPMIELALHSAESDTVLYTQ